MTKRRAESSCLHETLHHPHLPPQKKCRSVRDAELELETVHAPPALCDLIGECRRKRPRSCGDHEPHHAGTPAAPEDSKRTATDRSVGAEDNGDARVSGTFRGTCDMASEEGARGSKPEKRTKMMSYDDNEDELCAFNSFQFWKTPLPALDLSLLDSPSTTELKDAAEEMET